MNTLLRTTLFSTLFVLLSVLPANAEPVRAIGPVMDVELSEACTRKTRRPIAEEISGRCTEEKGKHYFVDALPDCDCRLEKDADGHAVLRLTLPETELAAVELEEVTAVPAVFRPDTDDLNGVAHIL